MRAFDSKKIHLFASVVSGGTPKSDDAYWDGDIPFITPPDLNGLDGDSVSETRRTLTESGAFSGSSLVDSGVVFSCRAPVGHVGRVNERSAFNQGCKVLVSGENDRFIAYALVAHRPLLSSLANGTTFMEVSTSSVSNMAIPLPDLDTQRRIADYLDAETAQIDALVAELDEYVELLEKRKSEVVKKHFSKTQFPAVPLFTFVGMKSGDGISPEKQGDLEIPVYGGNGIMGFTATPNRLHDSIVIGRVGALCGNVHLAKAPFFVSDNALVVDIQSEVNLTWLVYSLRNLNLRDLSQSSAQPVITASKVLRQRVNLPPLDKQEEIAQHITQELARTDTIITQCRELKELLLKRRQVLITDCVTGKVEV